MLSVINNTLMYGYLDAFFENLENIAGTSICGKSLTNYECAS
jgi:hypothetical protein